MATIGSVLLSRTIYRGRPQDAISLAQGKSKSIRHRVAESALIQQHGGPARDNRQQIFPAAAPPPACLSMSSFSLMPISSFHIAWLVSRCRDVKSLVAGVLRPTDRAPPGRSRGAGCGGHGYCLDIVAGCGTIQAPTASGKGGFPPRLALLPPCSPAGAFSSASIPLRRGCEEDV